MSQQLSMVAREILLENATTFKERAEIRSIVDEAANQIDNALINKLYDNALKKAHVNFGTIAISKGDITKYEGYQPMLNVIDTLKGLSKQSGVTIPELETVERSIEYIRSMKNDFELGYKVKSAFVIMSYQTLVYACIESTSALISSYVDFVKSPDMIMIKITKSDHKGKWVCIENLEKFNSSVKSGEFGKVIKMVNENVVSKNNFLGTATVATISAIAGTILVVTIIRELIYYFYNTRKNISEYLEQQAELLEINKKSIELNSQLTSAKKKEIQKKQEKSIAKLKKISDGLKVSSTLAEKEAKGLIKDENKKFTLKDLQEPNINSDTSIGLL